MEDEPQKITIEEVAGQKEVLRTLLFVALMPGKIRVVHLLELGRHFTLDTLVKIEGVHFDGEFIQFSSPAQLMRHIALDEYQEGCYLLAQYFQNRNYLSPHEIAELWRKAGEYEKSWSCYATMFNNLSLTKDPETSIEKCKDLLSLDVYPLEIQIKIYEHLFLCLEYKSDLPTAIEYKTQLIQRLQKDNYILQKAYFLRSLSIDLAKSGEWFQYKKSREDAALLFTMAGEWKESATEHLSLSSRGFDELDIPYGLKNASKACDYAELSGDVGLCVKSKAMYGYLLAIEGRFEEGIGHAHHALQLGLNTNLLEESAYAYRKLAGAYEYASEFIRAKNVYEQAVSFCQTSGMDVQVQMCYSCLSWIFLRTGDWDEALKVCLPMVDNPEVNNSSKATAHCIIGLISIFKGDHTTALTHIKQGLILARKENFKVMYHLLYLGMAKIAEVSRELSVAGEWYNKIVDEWEETKEKHDVLFSIMQAACFFRENVNEQKLKKSIEIIFYISQQTGNPEGMGCLAFVLGQDALLHNNYSLALEHFHKSRKYYQSLDVPYQLFLIDFNCAETFMKAGLPEEAAHLTEALLLKSEEMNLGPVKEKILKLKYGHCPPIPEYSLTRRQQEVLQLLCQGKSNKEIASALRLSTRTVDMHVRDLLAKMECSSRTEIIRIALNRQLVH